MDKATNILSNLNSGTERANYCIAVLHDYQSKKISLEELSNAMKALMVEDIKNDKFGESQIPMEIKRLELEKIDIRGEIKRLKKEDNMRFDQLSERYKKCVERLNRYKNILHGINQWKSEINKDIEVEKLEPEPSRVYYWQE